MVSVRSATSTETSQGVTPVVQATEGEEQEKGTGEFESFLRSIIAPNSENKVNEEELFAGLLQERVKTLKGDEGEAEFKSFFEESKNALRKGDGYVPYEDCAKEAIRKMVEKGTVTKEEADKAYSEAFQGAQLDSNTSALFDGRGGAGDATIALEEMEKALLAARVLIDKFDSGEETAAARSIDESTPGKAAASVSSTDPGVVVDPSSVPDDVSPTGTTVDGPDGFLFKPISENQGTLAVLMPEALAYQVVELLLKDENGNVVEKGQSTGYGDLGTREKYSFSKKGSDYPQNLVVEATLEDGTVKRWTIPDPSQRYD